MRPEQLNGSNSFKTNQRVMNHDYLQKCCLPACKNAALAGYWNCDFHYNFFGATKITQKVKMQVNPQQSLGKCLAINSKQLPCKATPIENSNYCRAHTSKVNTNQNNVQQEQAKIAEKTKPLTKDQACFKAEDPVEALQENYKKVNEETLNIKSKLANSQQIKKELTRLGASEDCLTVEDIANQEQIIEAKKKEVEEMKRDIEKIEQQLAKARITAISIATLKQNPQLLTGLEEEELKSRLQLTQKALSSIQGDSHSSIDQYLHVQEEARKELECVICLEVPKAGEHIFSCDDHHLLCNKCNAMSITSCPVCRHFFGTSSPKRNRLAEKMIQKLA